MLTGQVVFVPVRTGTRWCRSVRRADLYNIYTLLLSTLLTLKTPSPLSAVILWSVEDTAGGICFRQCLTKLRGWFRRNAGMSYVYRRMLSKHFTLRLSYLYIQMHVYSLRSLCQKNWTDMNTIFCMLNAYTVLTFWVWKINLSGISPTKRSRSGPTGLHGQVLTGLTTLSEFWARWTHFSGDCSVSYSI